MIEHTRSMIKRKGLPVGSRYREQRGIVLISCIIFLLLILMLLKISLSSSRISEQKSGIDHEIMTAQESAQLALREAESEILSVIPKSKLSLCKSNTASPECKKNFKKAIELAWIMASAKISSDAGVEKIDTCSDTGCLAWSETFKKRVNNAYIDKKFTASDRENIKKAAEEIKKRPGFYSSKDKCDEEKSPLWHCVKWNSGDDKHYFSGNGKLSSVEANSIRDLNKKYDIAPRYIVERFLPGEVDMPDDANLLFRVTAVGFGQSGGSDKNVTNAVFQANYIL